MPNLEHAIKAHKQSLKKKSGNLKQKVAFRTTIKKIKKLLEEGKVSEAEQFLAKAYKALDKAALKTVERWEFLPAQSGSIRFASKINIAIQFALIKEL